jgi:hypothetical protein
MASPLLCNNVNQNGLRDVTYITVEHSCHICDILTFYSTLLEPNTALSHSLVCMLDSPSCLPVVHMQLRNLNESVANAVCVKLEKNSAEKISK